MRSARNKADFARNICGKFNHLEDASKARKIDSSGAASDNPVD